MRREFTSCGETLKAWGGVLVEALVYDGISHAIAGAEIKDTCRWLKKAGASVLSWK